MKLAGSDEIGVGCGRVLRLHHKGMPDVHLAILHWGVGDQKNGLRITSHVRDEIPRPVIGREGVQNGTYAIGADQRAMRTTLTLGGRMPFELILILLHFRAMDRTEMSIVCNVVHNLHRVL